MPFLRSVGGSPLRFVPLQLLLITMAGLVLLSCGGDDTGGSSGEAGRPSGTSSGSGARGARGGPGGMGGAPAEPTSIPVRVVGLERRRVSDYLQTTGALEAENEVDIVARTSGPVIELSTEEGRRVRKGQVLARLDDRELRADLELAKVSLIETKAAFDRARRSLEEEIISAEAFDVTKARFETAKAQITTREIQLSYTEIRAPISGRIVERLIKQGEHVTNGARLFRVSDFDPLLCPIYLPEKDLRRVSVGQKAVISVEAFPDETFTASVLRINPVIDRTNGTFKVTLEARGKGRLRPGMFASVFLEVAAHDDAMVVPKRALVLEGVGDTVYVFADGVAERREVTLGFEEATHVEVLEGLQGDEEVIVLGQDSLTDGTPIYILEREVRTSDSVVTEPAEAPSERPSQPQASTPDSASGATGLSVPRGGAPGATSEGGGGRRGRRGGMPQVDWEDPKQVERLKERMRSFGMSEDQIDQRIEGMKRGETPGRRGGQGQGQGQGQDEAQGPPKDGGGPQPDRNDDSGVSFE